MRGSYCCQCLPPAGQPAVCANAAGYASENVLRLWSAISLTWVRLLVVLLTLPPSRTERFYAYTIPLLSGTACA